MRHATATVTHLADYHASDYLIDQVKSGQITELQTSLNERNLTPTDPRIPPFLRQEQIQEILSMVLPIERNMREHGDPTPLPQGRWLDAFADD